MLAVADGMRLLSSGITSTGFACNFLFLRLYICFIENNTCMSIQRLQAVLLTIPCLVSAPELFQPCIDILQHITVRKQQHDCMHSWSTTYTQAKSKSYLITLVAHF